MKKVYLDNLPRGGKSISSNKINWKMSVGYKVKFIYNDIKGFLEIVDYERNKKNHLTLRYNNYECEIYTGTFIEGKIGKLLKKKTNEYKFSIGDELNNLKIIERKKETVKGITYKKYKIECKNCGFNGNMKNYSLQTKEEKDEHWIIESNLFKMNTEYCPCCTFPLQVVVRGINDIATTHTDLASYFKNIEDTYTHSFGSTDKVLMQCPDCGNIRKAQINKLIEDGFSCKKCGGGQSYPNKIMFNVLEALRIKFIPEYSPKWIGLKRYDFYIPSMNLIIEMDGGLGHGKKDNNMNGMSKEESKARDDYKDEQARLHGIEVIRIDCVYPRNRTKFQYIKNNIVNMLNNILKLNMINWDEIKIKCLNNRVKEICMFYKNNFNDFIIEDISKKYNISEWLVKEYLKTGNELNWCVYKTIKKSNKLQLKKSTIKNNKSLKIRKVSYKHREIKYKQYYIYSIDNLNTSLLKVGDYNSCVRWLILNKICDKTKTAKQAISQNINKFTLYKGNLLFTYDSIEKLNLDLTKFEKEYVYIYDCNYKLLYKNNQKTKCSIWLVNNGYKDTINGARSEINRRLNNIEKHNKLYFTNKPIEEVLKHYKPKEKVYKYFIYNKFYKMLFKGENLKQCGEWMKENNFIGNEGSSIRIINKNINNYNKPWVSQYRKYSQEPLIFTDKLKELHNRELVQAS